MAAEISSSLAPSALEALRGATAEAHRALHVHPFMMERLRDGVTARSYADFLSLFEALWRELEAGLAAHDPQAQIASRAPLFERDFEALCLAPRLIEPLWGDSPNEAQTMALRYTLLGSSLGSRQLLDEVRAQREDLPSSYLGFQGAAAEWRRTSKALRRLTIATNLCEGVCGAALTCFAKIDRELTLFLHE